MKSNNQRSIMKKVLFAILSAVAVAASAET